MSTEYYLRRAPKVCPTCGHDPMAEEVRVGHSAGGWVFLWDGWHTAERSPAGWPLDKPSAWFRFLVEEDKRGSLIMDEYGRGFEVTEFFDLVSSMRFSNGHPSLRHSNLTGTDAVHVNGDDFRFHDTREGP